MDIINSINSARSYGINDDEILNEIYKQNPQKKSSFEQAVSRGATATDIINEVIKQNSKITPEKGILRKVGDFFTSSTQKFAQTLGAAASVIDPKTKKMREETISSAQQQADMYMEMAKKETDKTKKEKYLKAAMTIADTEDLDIFNNPEYQKTAKQVFGEGAGVALETLSWGKVGNLAKSSRALTAGQMALRSAGTSGTIGAISGASQALQENKSTKDIATSGLASGATGALIGGATGYIAGKALGKASKKESIELVSERLSDKTKQIAYKEGRGKSATLLKSEKILPSKKDVELGKVAQEIGLKGKNFEKNISKASKELSTEASKLKNLLANNKAIYNKNNIKGTLNKMKADKVVDLLPEEEKVYNKMISKFIKMAESKDNKKLDGLLELRQEFDSWAKSNNPNIFSKRSGGAYRALTSIRDVINDYINNKVGDNVVKQSLKKQSNLYSIIDNLAEKVVKGQTKLKQSTVSRVGKKLLPWAIAGGAGSVGAKTFID